MTAWARGGDVTYHAPGQLVGYPIIDLDAPACVKAFDDKRILADIVIALGLPCAGGEHEHEDHSSGCDPHRSSAMTTQ